MNKKWLHLSVAIVCLICLFISVWLLIEDFQTGSRMRWIDVMRIFLFTVLCYANTARYLQQRKAE